MLALTGLPSSSVTVRGSAMGMAPRRLVITFAATTISSYEIIKTRRSRSLLSVNAQYSELGTIGQMGWPAEPLSRSTRATKPTRP